MDVRREADLARLTDKRDLTRDARLKARAAKHTEELEERDLRISAQAVALRLAESEVPDGAELLPVMPSNQCGAADITSELESVVASVPESNLRLCSHVGVYVSLSASRHRSLLAKLHFTEGYPSQPLAVDLESATIPPELLGKLKTAAEGACRKLASKPASKPQVLATVELLQQWLCSHQLLPAYQEIQELQSLLAEGSSKVLKMKDKPGILQVSICNGHSFLFAHASSS